MLFFFKYSTFQEEMRKERQKKNENMIIITVYFAFLYGTGIALNIVCLTWKGFKDGKKSET